MSAICGIIRLDAAAVEPRELERVAVRALNRGSGRYFFDGPVGIACLTMLTTPDGTGECRPVSSPTGAVVLAADVRLDNRAELARDADGRSARFPRTHDRAAAETETDADVMFRVLTSVDARTAREPCATARMIGDFAYALWNRETRELRLARDPMGLRSLYYRVEPHRVLFATEARQILAADGVAKRLNERTIAFYLTGMQTPAGAAFYDGIDAVRPGETVTIDRSGRVRRERFWQANPNNRIAYRDEHQYAEHFRSLFLEAVRCRMRARSPVAVSLSGGLDSAGVASAAGLLRETDPDIPEMRTYTWAFTEMPELDERENSRRVTDRYAMPTHDIPAEAVRPLSGYPDHGPHEDDPFFSMFQPFMNRVLAAAAADGASVVFYGNRGDVICGGDVADVPGLLRSGLVRTARRELGARARFERITRTSALLRYVAAPALCDLLPQPASRAMRLVLPPASAASEGPFTRAAAHVNRGFLERAGLPRRDPIDVDAESWPRSAQRSRYRHVFSPLVEHGLVFSERNAAVYGLGFADPWSDRRIAEFALSCQQHLLDRAVDAKRLARRALLGVMPTDAINAARKVSPGPWYLDALRGAARSTILSLITDGRCAQLGFIDEKRLRGDFDRFARGEAPVFDLWSTVTLEVWLRRYWDDQL